MASENENFILKEFLVGLIVLLLILFLLFAGLRKIIKQPFLKNFFSGRQAKIVKKEIDCASYQLFKDIKKDQKLELERLVKRSGWLDTKFRYTLSYPTVEKNKITYVINSSAAEVPQETNEINCTDQGVVTADLDKLLLSSLLNVSPEKLDNFAKFKTIERSTFLFTTKNQWENKLLLKGGLVLSGNAPASGERYCFALEVKGDAEVSGSEKIQTAAGELDVVKIETSWEATPSASLGNLRKLDECYQYTGTFDNVGKISLKEEVWFAQGLGIVKRHLTPVGVSGQIYFLPNGYLPLDVTDEIVAK